MKKLILCLLMGIVFASFAGGQDVESKTSVQILLIKKFLRAKFSNNFELLQKTTLPDKDLKILLQGGRAPKTGQEKERLEQFLSGISVEPQKSQNKNKERASFSINFGGNIMPLDIVKTKEGWKVDPKWWIALMRPPTEEIQTSKMFFFSLIMKRANDLLKLSVPNDKLYGLTAGNPPPGGEAGQFQHLCASMPMIEIKVGEKYINLSGQEVTNKDKEYRIFQGLFGFSGKKLFFKLKQINNKWKVDSQPFIDMAFKSESKNNIEKAKTEFDEKVFREQLFSTLDGEGDPAKLEKYLKQGISDELKTSLLNSAYQQYWYRNQSGELKKNSNWIQMIILLIDAGADIEKRDYAGETLLMQAIKGANGHNQELVKLLVEKGAEVNAKTKDGLYVIDTIPKFFKHDDFQKILKKAGAKSRMLSEADEKEIEAVIHRNNSKEILEKVLPFICYSTDSNWTQNLCIKLAGNSDNKVRGHALAAIPKIAMIHNKLDKDKIKPILENALKDTDKFVQEQAISTVGYVNNFLFWKIRNYQKRNKNENYTLKSNMCSIKIPNINTDLIEIKESQPNPGITQDVKFIGDNGWVCVVIITKIRKKLPKDDTVLTRVEDKCKSMPQLYGDNLIINNYKNDEGRRTLEEILKNATYDEISYPYGQGVDRSLKEIKTLSISQYIVRKGFLIECALFMKNDKYLPENEFIYNAKKRITEIIQGIKIK